MAKNKHRFNKKQSVRFTLVPGPIQNGKPTTLYRPVQNHSSKVSSKDAKKLIQQVSDYQYDEIEINGKAVDQTQIPAYILQQIRGRSDLIINQKLGFKYSAQEQQKMQQFDGDLYEEQLIDLDHEQQWGEIQNKQAQEEWEDQQYIEEQQQQEWQDQDFDDQDIETEQIHDEKQQKFVMKQEDFPTLNKITIEGKEYELTEEQIKLLDVLIPQNYDQFEIKGLKFQKFNDEGLSLDKKKQYEKFYSTGKEGITDTFDYVPLKPTPIYDTDLKPTEIVGDIKDVEDALNYEGEQQVYEELEDDFFAKLIQSEIKQNQKQNKNKGNNQNKVKPASNKAKAISDQADKKLKNVIIPEVTQKQDKQNIFAKYDELDQDILQEQITQDMLEKALQDFQNNIEPLNSKKAKHVQLQDEQDSSSMNRSNISMNFQQIQNREQYIGKDGELDWRCLSKKEKKEYMKTKIIKEYYDEIRERQIGEKLKGKKNITAEELHLKTLIKHLTFQEDHVMRKALQQHAKEQVNMQEPQQLSEESDEQDIVQYRQRTSIISSNLAEISEPSMRKKKKEEKDQSSQSASFQKIKVVPEKRDRNETKEQRKQRKQKLKQLKKAKKEQSKQFIEEFQSQKRKHLKINKPSDPLHRISYVKIM